jgi:hypothetical protein
VSCGKRAGDLCVSATIICAGAGEGVPVRCKLSVLSASAYIIKVIINQRAAC